jgi:hypothetical protein
LSDEPYVCSLAVCCDGVGKALPPYTHSWDCKCVTVQLADLGRESARLKELIVRKDKPAALEAFDWLQRL